MYTNNRSHCLAMSLFHQPTLFGREQKLARELLPYGGSAFYYPAAFTAAECSRFFDALIATTDWRQERAYLYGKVHPVPRETAWFGDSGSTYAYSKIRHHPAPWTPVLLSIKSRVESIAGVAFNAVLLNRYRSGADSVAWHADDEPELGPQPTIASVSFGATRTFQMKSTGDPTDRIRIALEDGSLLVMRGASQQNWKHQVPKERSVTGERVNLTFRVMFPQSR